MKPQFKIVDVAPERGAVCVEYFYADKPEVKVGPYWQELPIDEHGEPICGDQLIENISNACPLSILVRARILSSYKPDMLEQKSLVGKAFDVRPSSPTISFHQPSQV